MTGVTLLELIDYSDHDRAKWKAWFTADPSRLNIPFQAAGRFPTVGALLDHIFLVERRHLSRLEGATPPDTTGVAPGDVKALFEYADLVRADYRTFAAELDDVTARETMTVNVRSGQPREMTRRRLAIHIVVHELRHMAQVAFAARLAGHEPPGEHDLFYAPESA